MRCWYITHMNVHSNLLQARASWCVCGIARWKVIFAPVRMFARTRICITYQYCSCVLTTLRKVPNTEVTLDVPDHRESVMMIRWGSPLPGVSEREVLPKWEAPAELKPMSASGVRTNALVCDTEISPARRRFRNGICTDCYSQINRWRLNYTAINKCMV